MSWRGVFWIEASGGTPANLSAMVLLSGFGIACVGILCGLGLGTIWSRVVNDVVAGSLGYHIEHRADVPATLWIVGAALILSVLSGIAPARLGRESVAAPISDLS